jgi:two-component system NtrC family response regulator
MERPKLLIVDDDEDLRLQMKWAFADEYDVLLASDRASALEAVKTQKPRLVTLDLGLPPSPRETTEGMAALAEILRQDPAARVVVITGREEREHALNAIAEGAQDYFCKPIAVEELKVVLRRALHVQELEREHRDANARAPLEAFEDMLGTSKQMHEVFASVRKVAPSDAPVLVVGESGTGKELVALAIHRLSPRGKGPFVAINCGAIPENLLESELFGHEKGSFTGAHAQQRGRIESAQGGTLFLDEIAELPPPLQVKLLRFLQERRIIRVGGREELDVDTRVVAATNVDLEKAMNEGRFRRDLYYRLGVVVITVPPLRERGDDVVLIANALLERSSAGEGKRLSFTAQALRSLQTHRWPGNVRELENRVKRAVVMADGQRVTPDDLELSSPLVRGERRGLREARAALEREAIQKALVGNRWNITQAAAELGISRPTLYERIEKLGISREDPKQ